MPKHIAARPIAFLNQPAQGIILPGPALVQMVERRLGEQARFRSMPVRVPVGIAGEIDQ